MLFVDRPEKIVGGCGHLGWSLALCLGAIRSVWVVVRRDLGSKVIRVPALVMEWSAATLVRCHWRFVGLRVFLLLFYAMSLARFVAVCP